MLAACSLPSFCSLLLSHSEGQPYGLPVLLFFFFCFLGLVPADGGSQARGPIRAVTASLHHSHSNVGSEPHLGPTPQLMAMPDP